MKLKSLILQLTTLALFLVCESHAQSKETLYYDENWKGVATKAEAKFFRNISYDSKGNPIGEIRDYYVSGELQAKIEGAKSINRFDDSKSIFVGRGESYYQNGKVEEVFSRDSEGKMLTDTYYFESGKIKITTQYQNGNLHGMVKNYYESGKVYLETPYENGLINGTVIAYSPTGAKTKEMEFVDGEKKYDWYLEYNDEGKAYKYDFNTFQPYKEAVSKEIDGMQNNIVGFPEV